jgi:Flp pilus assembly pilin Flp
MRAVFQRVWKEDEGVLSFEWVLILTLLVIGTVGGMCGVRDAINSEFGGVAGAAVNLDQSYNVPVSTKYQLGTAFSYSDTKGTLTMERENGTTPQVVGTFDPSK